MSKEWYVPPVSDVLVDSLHVAVYQSHLSNITELVLENLVADNLGFLVLVQASVLGTLRLASDSGGLAGSERVEVVGTSMC